MSSNNSQTEAEHLASIVMEKFQDELATLLENIDSRISHQLTPVNDKLSQLSEDSETIKAAVTATNKDLQALDIAVGNVEHRVDSSHTFSQLTYSQMRTAHKDLEKRVTQLEVAA